VEQRHHAEALKEEVMKLFDINLQQYRHHEHDANLASKPSQGSFIPKNPAVCSRFNQNSFCVYVLLSSYAGQMLPLNPKGHRYTD
jgi:hypothetical protein